MACSPQKSYQLNITFQRQSKGIGIQRNKTKEVNDHTFEQEKSQKEDG